LPIKPILYAVDVGYLLQKAIRKKKGSYGSRQGLPFPLLEGMVKLPKHQRTFLRKDAYPLAPKQG
jgi:hypothetical protein